MGAYGGPNITEEGVVLHYDLANSKSYKGEPTTNHVPDADTMLNWSPYGAGNNGTFITEFGTTGYRILSKASWNGLYRSITVPSTGTYTASAWFRYLGGTGANNGAQVYLNSYSGASGDDYGVSLNKNLVGEWQRVSATRNITDTTFNFYIISHGGSSGTDYSSWEVTMPQVELGDHATQFTPGTRTSTQSVLDLSRNSTMDVTGASFDSSATLLFDGSNDEIQVSVDDWIRTVDSITIEGVVEIPSGVSMGGGPWSIMTDHPTNSDRDGFWWHMVLGGGYVYFRVEDDVRGEQGITFSTPSPFSSGNTYHIVTVVGNAGVFLYVNGELAHSYSPSFKWSDISSSQTASLILGRTFPGYYISTTTHYVKLFDRPLSPTEVAENFNGVRSRFGI